MFHAKWRGHNKMLKQVGRRRCTNRGNTQWTVDVLAILTPTAGIVQG